MKCAGNWKTQVGAQSQPMETRSPKVEGFVKGQIRQEEKEESK
jgi:hypothetical protein